MVECGLDKLLITVNACEPFEVSITDYSERSDKFKATQVQSTDYSECLYRNSASLTKLNRPQPISLRVAKSDYRLMLRNK